MIIKKFVKGQVDYSKATLKSILFGGGGAKIPEYRNKNDKPVFSDPSKVLTFVDFYLQSVCPFCKVRMFNSPFNRETLDYGRRTHGREPSD